MRWLAEATKQGLAGERAPIFISLARVPGGTDAPVDLTPERLFGRHCAVLGATGGGKSWTLARMLEELSQYGSKIVLIDATGEFYTLTTAVKHLYIGQQADLAVGASEVVFPHSELTESDLSSLFKPSGQVQAPKLRAAMKSLKLAKLEPQLATNGVIDKVQKAKKPYDTAYQKWIKSIESPRAEFEVSKLTQQINAECVWPSAGTQTAPNYNVWGNANEADRSNCVTLINRIEDMLTAPEFACIFATAGKTPLSTAITEFLNDPEQRVLRVSLKHVPFASNAREVIANAIGRHLLVRAREGQFKERPVIVFLDEAHQSLSKTLGEESTRYPLDAFDLIAKEGRKYSINICIATQRPRDIPEDVLSQIGTLIVHRLINDKDREVVERAWGEIDKSAAAFLPTLDEGRAVIIGVDFPIPLTVQIIEPRSRPDSKGPDYQAHWPLKGEEGEY